MEYSKYESKGQLGIELRSQVFWDITLWHWVSVFRNSKECNVFIFKR